MAHQKAIFKHDDQYEEVVPDSAPRHEHDSLGERLATRSTRWTLDLLDPYAWLDETG